MKNFLENLISEKQKEIDTMRQRAKDSQDIEEVRSLGIQIEDAKGEQAKYRAKLDEYNAQHQEEKIDNNAASLKAAPGRVVASFDTRSNESQQARDLEARAKAFAQTGRQTVPVAEARAVLVSGGKIATPTEVGGINDAFNQVSSIVDMVKVTNCQGMGSYKVAYEIASATATTQTEGAEAAASDMTYGFVEIVPQTEAVVSYISKQVRKQSPLNYTEKVSASAKTALRKRAVKIITDKILASDLIEAKALTAIDDKTLRTMALTYGGDEGIEGGAVLQLCKADLIKFGDVRGTQDKKAVYEITPDASNPNTGIIKDGGLAVKYCLNSNLASGKLVYGDPMCFELGLFSNYEIAVSEDHSITKLMLTIVGDVELGGEVVVNKGFVVGTVGA